MQAFLKGGTIFPLHDIKGQMYMRWLKNLLGCKHQNYWPRCEGIRYETLGYNTGLKGMEIQ